MHTINNRAAGRSAATLTFLLTSALICTTSSAQKDPPLAPPDAKTANAVLMKPSTTVVVEKLTPLGQETQRLHAMAVDLKKDVDKTNRNILSVTVVHKAEAIEKYARQLKLEAKK